MFPALFVSHGSPMIVLESSPARDFLSNLGRSLGRPKAILLISAHFETMSPSLSADAHPAMIYDFGGFPRPLYEMVYPAPGSPDLAARAAKLLADSGAAAQLVHDRGFDHGTWCPLKLMYPEADIPVVQASVLHQGGAAQHLALGRALAPLRHEDVLIIGSGSLTHNLRELRLSGRNADAEIQDWAQSFSDWIAARIESGAYDDIAHYRERAPHAVRNHPTEEHFLPLPVAIGAAGDGAKGRRLHASFQYGALAMDAYAFA